MKIIQNLEVKLFLNIIQYMYYLGFPTESVGRVFQNFFRWLYLTAAHFLQSVINIFHYLFFGCFANWRNNATPYESIPLSDLVERGQSRSNINTNIAISNVNSATTNMSSGSKSNNVRYYSSTARNTATGAVNNFSTTSNRANSIKGNNPVIEL